MQGTRKTGHAVYQVSAKVQRIGMALAVKELSRQPRHIDGLALSVWVDHETGTVNVEVPVRVMDKKAFVENLALEDFDILTSTTQLIRERPGCQIQIHL